MTKKISIAVLSDLHCHEPYGPKVNAESFLIADSPRVPPHQHPVQSLIELAKKHSMKADAIICCGDMSNKASQIGLSHSWHLIKTDIKEAFKAENVFCTIGNHDVASRKASPFSMAQSIDPEFPFADNTDNALFWTRGFLLQKLNGADFLIINTSYNHWNEALAKTGQFDDIKIAELEDCLEKEKASRAALRIAVLHHHPIVHSSPISDSSDVLPNGDKLMEILSKYDFRLVLHGHKHEPRMTRHSVGSNQIHVLCAGTFSAQSSKILSRTRNLFHYVELSHDKESNPPYTGKVETWEYGYGIGWRPATLQSSTFPHRFFIGLQPDLSLVQNIIKYFANQKVVYIPKKEITTQFPSVDYLLPHELINFYEQLSENGLKPKFDGIGSLDSIWRPHGSSD